MSTIKVKMKTPWQIHLPNTTPGAIARALVVGNHLTGDHWADLSQIAREIQNELEAEWGGTDHSIALSDLTALREAVAAAIPTARAYASTEAAAYAIRALIFAGDRHAPPNARGWYKARKAAEEILAKMVMPPFDPKADA